MGYPLPTVLTPAEGQLKVGCAPFTAGNTEVEKWQQE